MDEEQQYLANLSYQEEQKDQEYFNVLKMRANGISDEGIQRNYADFAVRQQPTFSTSPKDNKSLSNILSVAPAIMNPELREDPAYKQLYADYTEFKLEKSIGDSGIVLGGVSNIGREIGKVSKTIKGAVDNINLFVEGKGMVPRDITTAGGVIQRTDTPFSTKYDDLDKDSKKALDWLDALMVNKDPNSAQNLKTLETISNVSGMFADGAMIQMGLGSSGASVAKAVRTGNALKAEGIIGQAVAQHFINKVPANITKISKSLVASSRIALGFAEGTATGLAFSARDLFMDDTLADKETGEQAKQLVSQFGVGLGIDVILGVAGSIIAPALKNTKRWFLTPNSGNLGKNNLKDTDDAVALAVKALSGKLDDNTATAIRREGLGESADILQEIQGEVIKIQNLQKAGLDEEAMVSMLAIGSDMRVRKVEQGFEVVLDATGKGKKTKIVSSLGEVVDLIEVKNLKGINKKTVVEAAQAASVAEELKIQRVWETTKKSANSKLDVTEFAEAIVPRSGSFNAKTKNGGLKLVKVAIKELGEGVQEGLDELDVVLSSKFFKNIPNVKSNTLVLPRQIKNANELRQYTKYIGNFITEHGNNINKTDLDTVLDTFGQATGKWSLNDMEWITKQAKNLNLDIRKLDGEYYVNDGVKTVAFATEELLGNYVHSKSITPDSFKQFLKNEKSYSLVRDPDLNKWVVMNQAKSVVAVGDTIADITAHNVMLRPKYPIETAPLLGFVTDDINSIEVLGDYVMGSVSQHNKYFDNYAQTKMMSDLFGAKKTQYIKNKSGIKVQLKNDNSRWIVSADNFGMTPQRFKSEKDLKKFLEKVGTPEKTLQVVGGQKGVAVLANKAGYIVTKAGETDQVFKTFADATDYVKRLPSKALTPEIMADQAENIKIAEELFGPQYKNVNPDNFTEVVEVALLKKAWEAADLKKLSKESKFRMPKPLRNIANRLVPNRTQIYSMAKGKPELRELGQAFDAILESEKRMNAMQSTIDGALAVVHKNVPEVRRRQLGQLLSKNMSPEDWDDNFKKITGGTLNGDDKKYLTAVRNIYDQAGKLNGFGDSLDTVENYFTRFKTLTPDDIFSIDPKKTVLILAEKAFGRKLNPAEKKFFQNMRKVDLAGYVFEVDPSKVLDRYVRDSMRNFYLTPAIENFSRTGERLLPDGAELKAVRDMVKQARGLDDDIITSNLKQYFDDVALKNYANTAKSFAKATGSGKGTDKYKAFMQGKVLKLSKEAVANMTDIEQEAFSNAIAKHRFGQNPINKVMGVVTLSVQSGKLWLPVRNTFQPETHLAPIFGLEAVVKAKEDVSKLSKEGYMALAKRGIFQTKSIQAQLGNQGTGAVEWLNARGLAWFKSTDDIDRAVGYMTVRNALMEGIEGSTAWGDKSGTFFSQQSRLYAAPKHIRDNVLSAISNGNMDDAVTTYAQWMNDMTFLNYSTINKPAAFGSFFGRVFGQMGTFATQTLASRKYFMENLTKADKAFYAGRAVLAGFALNSMFSELTGTEVNNFSTLNSMMFMGGPVVGTGIATLDVFSGSDYRQSKGVSALKLQAKNLFTPANTIIKTAKGIQKIAEGDIYNGLLGVMNFPGGGEGTFEDATYEDLFGRF